MQNSYKKSGVNISLANKLVKHISNLSKKNVKKRKKSFKEDTIGGFGSLYDISKTKIKDLITFENEVQIYQKIPANLFTFLIKKFSFDYVYDRYVNDLKELREMFDLTQSPILWFTQHPSVEHNPDPSILGMIKKVEHLIKIID